MDKQQKIALILLPILAIAILAGGMFISNQGKQASAAAYTDGVYEGEGQGFAGPIKVKVTVEGGKITSIELLEHGETAGIGDVGAQNVIDSIIEQQKLDVDVSSGATMSSNGVMEAVKSALAGAGPQSFTDGEYEGEGQGFAGPIKVKVVVEGGKITSIELLEHGETPGIGDTGAENVIDSIVEQQKLDVDVSSGATYSSNGVMEAVKNALGIGGETAAEEETVEEVVEDIEFVDGVYEGAAKGFGGDVKVRVEVKDGQLVKIELLEQSETQGLGDIALEDLSVTMINEQTVNVDDKTGATYSSKAIKEAVINALKSEAVEATADAPDNEKEKLEEEAKELTEKLEEKAKEEPKKEEPKKEEAKPAADGYKDGTYTGTAKGFGGDLEIEVTIKDGKIASVKATKSSETPGIGDKGIEEVAKKIIAKQSASVDAHSGATMSSNATMEAVKQALGKAK